MRLTSALGSVLFLTAACAGPQPHRPATAAVPTPPERAASAVGNARPADDDLSGWVRFYEAEVETAPQDPRMWAGLTSMLRRANRLQEAARAGWTAVELAPDAWQHWYDVGNVLMQAQALESAAAAMEQAAARGAPPERAAKGLLDVGYRAWGLGQDALAQRLFDRVAELTPKLVQLEYDRALLHASRGERALAQAAARRGLATVGEMQGPLPQEVAWMRDALRRLEGGEVVDRAGLLWPSQALPGRFLTRPQGPARALQLDPTAERAYPVSGGGRMRLVTPTTWTEVAMPQGISEPGGALILEAPMPGGWPSMLVMPAPLAPRVPDTRLAEHVVEQLRGLRVQPEAAEPVSAGALRGVVACGPGAVRPGARRGCEAVVNAGERQVTLIWASDRDTPDTREDFLRILRSLEFVPEPVAQGR